MQGALHHAPTKRNLERIVFKPPGSFEGRFRRTPGNIFIKGLPLQQRLCFVRAPGEGRDAAQPYARVTHHTVLDVEGYRGRRQRKFIGLTIAHLQVYRARPGGRGW